MAASAQAVQFPFLDSAYQQEIYTGPLVGGPGMAWTSAGALLTRDGANIYEYSTTQNAIHQGTNVHGYTTHTISGLAGDGYGMANGNDGYIYTMTSGGLQRFDPSNWGAGATSLAATATGGGGYGVHAMADGRIAYVAGGGTNEVYIYDPSTNINQHIYTAAGLIDDIAVDPLGNLALAGQALNQLIVISNTGTTLTTVNCVHFPDGLAFGDGINSGMIFANNNDGTITKYVFNPGYTSLASQTDIATGAGSYGDLAEVGPDCAFYVSVNENGSLHGATPGVGTHWDNGVTNAENSIVRISLKNGDCGFYHPFETTPEPASMLALGGGLLLVIKRRRRR